MQTAFLLSMSVFTLMATDYLSIESAQRRLFGDKADYIFTKTPADKRLVKAVKKQAGVTLRPDRIRIWQAIEEGRQLGWVYEDQVIGKHEFITYAVGVDMNGRVVDVVILSYRETHGGEIMRPTWLAQFRGKTAEQPFKMGVDIEAISGATLSVRNVCDGVKKLLILNELALLHE
ncbi:MAG: FMN-binding protein [Acidobacteria bacterium]|nr:FMN-binding protein [Acidobacteriota bacterium]